MSLDKGKMPKIDASGYRYAIAASRFNKELVDALVRDAVETLHGCGVNAENVRLVRVPGAAELPHVCNMLAQQLDISADSITPQSEVVKDLGADSLDVVELMMDLEDEYGITLPEGDVEKIKTVQDIVDMMEKLAK